MKDISVADIAFFGVVKLYRQISNRIGAKKINDWRETGLVTKKVGRVV